VQEVTVGGGAQPAPAVQPGSIQTQAAPIGTIISPPIATCRGGATQGFTGTAACGAQAPYTYCYTGCNGTPFYGYNGTSAFPCH